MYRRKQRSGRRDGGLYQARLHQKIQQRIEDREAQRQPLTYPQLRQRAEEAKAHDCEHTHIHPEYLLHLLDLRERYLKLRGLVEGHWKDAEGKKPYNDRDLLLWTQGLGWFERQQE